MLYIILRFIFI